jgi:hypothetical protein
MTCHVIMLSLRTELLAHTRPVFYGVAPANLCTPSAHGTACGWLVIRIEIGIHPHLLDDTVSTTSSKSAFACHNSSIDPIRSTSILVFPLRDMSYFPNKTCRSPCQDQERRATYIEAGPHWNCAKHLAPRLRCLSHWTLELP